MKILSGIVGFVVLLFVLSFALSNQQDIALSLWPFFADFHAPLYLAGLAPLALGVVLGCLWGWVGSLPHRMHARRLGKEIEALKDKMDELQKAVVTQAAPILPRKSFWRIRK